MPIPNLLGELMLLETDTVLNHLITYRAACNANQGANIMLSDEKMLPATCAVQITTCGTKYISVFNKWQAAPIETIIIKPDVTKQLREQP